MLIDGERLVSAREIEMRCITFKFCFQIQLAPLHNGASLSLWQRLFPNHENIVGMGYGVGEAVAKAGRYCTDGQYQTPDRRSRDLYVVSALEVFYFIFIFINYKVREVSSMVGMVWYGMGSLQF